MTQPRHFRIFISSPGDVADERALALKVITDLQYDPALRGRLTLEPVAWDQKGAPPMEANLPPQTAIDEGLPKPSECDIVVVIFWSRMGTPLAFEGVSYESGTHYEYEQAMNANRATGSPRVLLYWRDEKIKTDIDDPQFDEKRDQFQRVKKFFAQFKDEETGALRGGYNRYVTPDAFRELLEDHLKIKLKQLLDEDLPAGGAPVIIPALSTEPPALWEGSPFPGLRAFKPADEPIFFGRGRETDALARHIAEGSRFLAVVGASGSGKSSLVGAGLIPRLHKTSGHGWRVVTLTPDELGIRNPFAALAAALMRDLSEINESKLADKLAKNPQLLIELFNRAFPTPETHILLFIDQFEEVFTTVEQQYRLPFVKMIAALTTLASTELQAEIPSTPQPLAHIVTVLTLRGDFYGACVEVPELAALLNVGSYNLPAPSLTALYEMIDRPAARAGLEFEPGLVQRILDDTGEEPGALALMAYTLDELYHGCKAGGILTTVAYDELGGVQGAIGKRSEATYAELDAKAQDALPRIFRELVEVDERGTATRQRAALSKAAPNEADLRLVNAFTEARLLVQSQGEGNKPYLEVAHEALLRSWERLAKWINDTQDDLRLLRVVRQAAQEWERTGHRDDYLWSHERLLPVYAMRERLGVEFTPLEQDFTRPEAERLVEEFKHSNVKEYRQKVIIDRLTEIGEEAIEGLIDCLAFSIRPTGSLLRRVRTSMKQPLIEALKMLDEPAILQLIATVNHTDSAMRQAAVEALGTIGRRTQPKARKNPFSSSSGTIT